MTLMKSLKQNNVLLSAIAILLLFATALPDLLTTRILLVKVHDESASAKGFTELHQHLCQIISQSLKFNDTLVSIPFADKTEITQDQTINNPLELLGRCQPTTTPTSLGQLPGTSFQRAVDRTLQVIAAKRTTGLTNPAVVSLTLQAAEPGPDQPTLDWQHIRSQLEKITADRGVVVITGATGDLQKDLGTELESIPRLHICPIANASTCLETAIATARQL